MLPEQHIARQLIAAKKQIEALQRLENPGAWAVAVSALSLLPGLRGLWPMSAVDENGDVYDFSEQDRVLSRNGNPQYNLDGIAPYINFDGVGDFLARADEAGLDILGTETFNHAAIRGLTIGGYFRFTNAVGAVEVMMSKSGDAGQRAYRIQRQAAGELRITISVDGTAQFSASSVTVPGANEWLYVVGRFDPSAEQAIFVNEEKTAETVGVPASIFNSNTDFNISGRLSGTNLLTGRASLCFLCAADIGDTLIRTIFQTTRGLFGI